jgi:hypothetical protein
MEVRIMVVRGEMAQRTIIVSDAFKVEVRGRWHREVDYHGDSGVTKVTVILKFGKDRPIRLNAIAEFDDAPVRLEAESLEEAAVEEANAAGEGAVRRLLILLSLALQHRPRELTTLVCTQFDLELKLNNFDPRESLAALEMSGQLAKLVRIAYAYIHCDIALRYAGKVSEVEELIGRKIAEFAWDYVEKSLDLRPILSAAKDETTALSAI